MGLVEHEWLETLSTINPDEVQYIDYVEMGNKLAAKLRQEVSFIIVFCRCAMHWSLGLQVFNVNDRILCFFLLSYDIFACIMMNYGTLQLVTKV